MSNTVFIVVFSGTLHEEEYCGVFSTRQKAEDYVASHASYEQDQFSILEEKVDEP